MSTITRNINLTQEAINIYHDLGNGMYAHKYGILTTSFVCYNVYESSSLFGNHSSITRHETYGYLADITTRRLPAELDALPAMSDERYQAVKAFHQELEAQAAAYIRQAFPQDFIGE